jgi:hypothetical protein
MNVKEQKIKNAVVFLASEHERLVHKPLGLDFLQRYLAFLDYSSLKRIRRQALGLLYSTMGRNPITAGFSEGDKKQKNDCFVLVPQRGGGYVVKATCEPDLGCFSSFEIHEMKRLVSINANRLKEGLEKREAVQGRTEKPADPDDQAQDRSDAYCLTQQKEESDMSSLHVLIQRYVKQLEELEMRTKEVKHKLETVMEASRLLEEEGLSDDTPSKASASTSPVEGSNATVIATEGSGRGIQGS